MERGFGSSCPCMPGEVVKWRIRPRGRDPGSSFEPSKATVRVHGTRDGTMGSIHYYSVEDSWSVIGGITSLQLREFNKDRFRPLHTVVLRLVTTRHELITPPESNQGRWASCLEMD